MFDFIKSLVRSAWKGLCSTARWFADRLSDMWAAHSQALKESAAYRRQVIALTGAVVTMLTLAAPAAGAFTAAVATYVAAHAVDDPPSSWSRGALEPSGYYEDRLLDERSWR